jgi:hypothetical protein
MSQWELLVTDGHVRAARWRAGAKFITGIGATLIILGFIGIWLTPQNNPVSRIAQAKQELVNARQNALTKFMAGKGAPPRPLPANAANATAMNNAESLIAGLLMVSVSAFSADTLTLAAIPKSTGGEFWETVERGARKAASDLLLSEHPIPPWPEDRSGSASLRALITMMRWWMGSAQLFSMCGDGLGSLLRIISG